MSLDHAIYGALIAALEGRALAIPFLEGWVKAGFTELSAKQRQVVLNLFREM